MILLALMACQTFVDFYSSDTDLGGSDTQVSETGQDSGESGPGPLEGRISGTVTVELYVENEDGEREFITMKEAYDGLYPYGPVFVTATTSSEEGPLQHHGSAVILEPTVGGDAYTLDVYGTEGAPITVYGALDVDGDGTIHSADPTGLHPHELDFETGTVLTDIDLSIVVAYDPELVGQQQEWQGGQDGGQGCTDLIVQGPVDVLNRGDATRGVAMLVDSNGSGPVDWVWFDVSPKGEGGVSEYTIPACANLGELLLVGAIDSNGNEVIDPEDTWGAVADLEGSDLNPVRVGTQDLLDQRIQIPTGDGSSPLDLVPFVRLGGTVSMQKGSFDDLEVGSTVYVAALKYRLGFDLNINSFETLAYDYQMYEWPDLTGKSVVDFSLGVPADTVVYLWAFADEDLDGIVNESGERVAPGGADGEGTYSTGSSDTNQNLQLATVE